MSRSGGRDAGVVTERGGYGPAVRAPRAAVGRADATRLSPLPTDALRTVLFLLVVVVLGRAHGLVPGLAALQPALVLVLAAGAAIAFRPRAVNWRASVRHWPARVMLALFALAIVGAPFGIHPWGSVSMAVKEYAKTLAIAFLVLLAIRRTGDLYTFVWAHVAATAVLALSALFVFDLQIYGSVARLGDMGMYDSNDLGCVLATSIPLVVLAWESARNRTARLVAGLVLLGSAVALARTGSRGGFVGVLVVGAILLWTMHHVEVWKRVGVVLVGLTGLLAAAPQGYWDRMESLTEPTEDYNWTDYYGRRRVAERGFAYMMDNPVFGVGYGNFPRADAMLAEEAHIPGHNKWRAPHNSFVQIGSELGVTGLLLWSSLIVGGVVTLWRIRRRLPRSWLQGGHERRFLYLFSVYMPVTLLGFAVTSFFLSFAYLVPVYLLAALLCGYFLSLRRHFRGAPRG